MVEYPTDILLNSDKDIAIDSANDIGLISGIRQLSQSVALDVMDEIPDIVGGRVTGQNIGLLEEKIRRGLNEDPQLSEVRSVNITEFNRQSNTLSMEVLVVDNDDFTLEDVQV